MRCVVAALTSSTSAPFTEAGNQDAVRLDHAGNKQWGGNWGDPCPGGLCRAGTMFLLGESSVTRTL